MELKGESRPVDIKEDGRSRRIELYRGTRWEVGIDVPAYSTWDRG